MIHELKAWPEPFQAVVDGAKTFDVRIDDRGYKVGDVLRLREWQTGPTVSGYTGREHLAKVTYIYRGNRLGNPVCLDPYVATALEGRAPGSEPAVVIMALVPLVMDEAGLIMTDAERTALLAGPPRSRPIRPDPRLRNLQGGYYCQHCDESISIGFGWWHRLVRGHWPKEAPHG